MRGPATARELKRGNRYASPVWPSVAATDTDAGPACGDSTTTHVSAVCSTRPSSTASNAALWSNGAIPAGTFSRGSDIALSAGDSVTLTMTASAGDPDLIVKVLGTGNLVNTTAAYDATNTVQQTANSAAAPTVLFVLPGMVPDVTAPASTTSYNCRPAAPGASTEACIIYAFKAATLSWGVYANTQSSVVNVSSSIESVRAEVPHSGSGTFTPGSSGWTPFTVPPDATAVFLLSWSNNSSPQDLDLYVKVNAPASTSNWDCRPHLDGSSPPSETCLVANASHTTSSQLEVFVDSPGGTAAWIDWSYGLLRPAGDCAASSVVNAATNQCCQCAANETPTHCPANQCGTSCGGGNIVCKINRCCSRSCPAGYTLAKGVCVPAHDSCANSVCNLGSCQLLGSSPTCVNSCSGGGLHVCSQQPEMCCDWTCPAGSIASAADGGDWQCL